MDWGMAELMQLSSSAWSSADGSSSAESTLSELSELLRENVTGVSSTLKAEQVITHWLLA